MSPCPAVAVDQPQEQLRADIQHQREQALVARDAAQTFEQKANEIAHVHAVMQLVADNAAVLRKVSISRLSYAAGRTVRTDTVRLRPSPMLTDDPVPVPKGQKRKDSESGPQPKAKEYATGTTPGASSASSRTSPMEVSAAAHSDMSRQQQGAPALPRHLADSFLRLLPKLPEKWPLAKIDLMLNHTEKFYSTWRRFLHLNEWLRTNDEHQAEATIAENANRLAEHLVQFLAEWVVMCLEPARPSTKAKDPDMLFLHDKDYWFRTIWIDIHQAITLDRDQSRDRAPVGLVRCVCKDEGARGESATAKLTLSNVQVFVPIWMATPIVRNLRVLRAVNEPKQTGGIDYKEGWFDVQDFATTTGGSLCGMQIHLNDFLLDNFNHLHYPAIRHFAAVGLVKPELWVVRAMRLGIQAKLEIPLSGTSFVLYRDAFTIENLPDSWPTDTNGAWTEQHSRGLLPFLDIVQSLEQFSFTIDLFDGDSDSAAFSWIKYMWPRWPKSAQSLGAWWDGLTVGYRTDHTAARSRRMVTDYEMRDLHRTVPVHPKVTAPISDYAQALRDNQSTSDAVAQHDILRQRQASAAARQADLAELAGLLVETFAADDADLVLDQLVVRNKGNITRFLQDQPALIDEIKHIVRDFNLTVLPAKDQPASSSTQPGGPPVAAP